MLVSVRPGGRDRERICRGLKEEIHCDRQIVAELGEPGSGPTSSGASRRHRFPGYQRCGCPSRTLFCKRPWESLGQKLWRFNLRRGDDYSPRSIAKRDDSKRGWVAGAIVNGFPAMALLIRRLMITLAYCASKGRPWNQFDRG